VVTISKHSSKSSQNPSENKTQNILWI